MLLTSRRLRVFAILALILAVAHPISSLPGARADDESASVSRFRGYPVLTGEMHSLGGDAGEAISGLRHSINLRSGFRLDDPAVIDGVVYVGSGDGYLYAIDAVTGQQRWASSIGEWIVAISPVIDGTVYVSTDDGNLFAIDAATGEQRWSFSTGDTQYSFSVSAASGIVYVGMFDGFLYALDADTGQQRWVFLTSDLVTVAPAVVDGVVYADDGDGNLHALDAATGEQRWVSATSEWIFSDPVVVDGVLYFGSGNGYLFAIDAATGEQRWVFETMGSINHPPTVVEGVVYFSSADDTLYALDAATGAERWNLTTSDSVESSPAVVEGIVYIGCYDGAVYAIDATSGQQRWVFTTGGSIALTPTVVDGVVYAGSGNGTLYAFDAPTGRLRWVFGTGGPAPFPPFFSIANGIIYAASVDTHLYAIDATTGQQRWSFTTGDAIVSLPVVVVAEPGISAGATVTEGSQDTAAPVADAQAWQTYLWTEISDAFTAEVAKGSEMDVDSYRGPGIAATTYIPSGSSNWASFPVTVDSATASAALAIFPSNEEASGAVTIKTDELHGSGWQEQSISDLGYDHVCLATVIGNENEAVCYVLRDDVAIVSFAEVFANPDAALQIAEDLANAMSDAYSQVARPDQ